MIFSLVMWLFQHRKLPVAQSRSYWTVLLCRAQEPTPLVHQKAPLEDEVQGPKPGGGS